MSGAFARRGSAEPEYFYVDPPQPIPIGAIRARPVPVNLNKFSSPSRKRGPSACPAKPGAIARIPTPMDETTTKARFPGASRGSVSTFASLELRCFLCGASQRSRGRVSNHARRRGDAILASLGSAFGRLRHHRGWSAEYALRAIPPYVVVPQLMPSIDPDGCRVCNEPPRG